MTNGFDDVILRVREITRKAFGYQLAVEHVAAKRLGYFGERDAARRSAATSGRPKVTSPE